MKFLNKINLKINEDFYDRIKVKQNDTARYLLFNLLDNGVPFSLENKTVRVYGLKPDGTKVFNNLTIINAAKGLAELQLTTQMLVKPGCLKLELVIYEATDILSTTKFDIDIISCIRDDGAIESTNEFSALTLGLSKLDEWDKYFKETSGAIEEKYTERLNGIASSLEETKKILLNKYKNIEYYRFLVTDEEDWTPAFQRAIDDTILTGEEIFFNGEYKYKSTLILKNGCKLQGANRDKTKLIYTGQGVAMTHENPEAMLTEKHTYINNLKLCDFTLKGQKIVGTTGLWITNGSNHKYSNLYVDGFDINVILGSSTKDHCLLFSELQFDTYNAISCSLLIRHIEDCIFPRNLIAGDGTKTCKYTIQIGDVTNKGQYAKPFDIVFNMCVFQGADVGVYHDGGYSVNFYGGHCEGLNKMVKQSSKTDSGLSFHGLTVSQTVLSKGDLTGNGINITSNGYSPKMFSQRLFYEYDGKSFPSRTTGFDAFNISCKIDFDRFQVGAFRIVAKIKTTTPSQKNISIIDNTSKTIVATLSTNEVGLLELTGEWKGYIPNNTLANGEHYFYVNITGAVDSETIELIYLDLQGTQFI